MLVPGYIISTTWEYLTAALIKPGVGITPALTE
jgi:hypothetical protein